MRPTFCTRLMLRLATGSKVVWVKSASRVLSVKKVSRATPLATSFSALNSAVQDFSGLRLGSLMNCELVVEVAPYSSLTVGMRTARPTDALSTVSCAHWYDNAAFGEKNDSRLSGHRVLT